MLPSKLCGIKPKQRPTAFTSLMNLVFCLSSCCPADGWHMSSHASVKIASAVILSLMRALARAENGERLETYSGKLVENIVQATARDLLFYSMQTLSQYFIVGHIHDEMIIECPKDTKLDEICQQMARTPDWANGLLLRADGYECSFYKKD